jgi:hypothetical protein
MKYSDSRNISHENKSLVNYWNIFNMWSQTTIQAKPVFRDDNQYFNGRQTIATSVGVQAECRLDPVVLRSHKDTTGWELFCRRNNILSCFQKRIPFNRLISPSINNEGGEDEMGGAFSTNGGEE